MTDKRFRLDTGCFIDMVENKVLSDKQANNMLNTLYEENKQVKQLIHTMLVQLDIEKIAAPDTLYSARIVFTTEEFQLIHKIWKGK